MEFFKNLISLAILNRNENDFLEEGKFGLNALLTDLEIPNRPGIIARPPFPKEFTVSNFGRQSTMTPMFLADPRLRKRKLDTWTGSFNKTTPGIKGDKLETVFKGVKAAIDKIRSRGGLVVFVRPPSSGDFLETEKRLYPRQQYWDPLLAYTETPGIHFSDYPQLQNFACPDWSHLTPDDAVAYTTHLVKILQKEKGWTFTKKYNLTSN